MIIVVTIEKPETTSPLSEVFGRSKYFLFNDTSEASIKIIPNPYVKELGGAGIQAARFLIENDAGVVVTKNIGVNPLRFLTSAEIKVYVCKEGSAIEVLQLLKDGKLNSVETINDDFSTERKRKRFGKNFPGKFFK